MFERLELVIGKDALELIKTKTILVVGIGGVGGSLVEALVRSGVSNIIIVDFDVVEESNLNRQRVATLSSIGRKKIDVMKEIILDINKDCLIKTYDILVDKDNINLLFDFDKIDYVLDACDDVAAKKALIEASFERGIKVISSMGTGNKLNPSMLEVVEIKNTVNDPLARIFRKWMKDNHSDKKLMVLSSRELPVRSGRVVGSTAFVPNSAGILIASYVIRDILKEKKETS